MRGRLLRGAALLLVVLVVAAATATTSFQRSSRSVVVGAHTTTVSPTFDSHATLDFGPLLPRMRLPTDQPLGLGVQIRVGDTDADDLDQLVARDAAIASQPAGEIARVTASVRDMLRTSVLEGLGWGLLTASGVVLVWTALGRRRRASVATAVRRPVRTVRAHPVVAAGTAAAVVVGLALVALPAGEDAETIADQPGDGTSVGSSWRGLRTYYPELPEDAVLDQVQLESGSVTRAGLALVDGALETYRTSVQFYGDLADAVDDVADQVRQPAEDETVAVFVTDRHDNVGMDPVAAAIGRAGGATMLIDAGDDTSTGGSWEAFSINALAAAFDGLEKVAIAGNHDTGSVVVDTMRDQGFTVLEGEPEQVGGVTFVGDSDPRSSGLTAGYDDQGSETLAEQDARLTEAACADDDASVGLVHSAASARELAASGCVDLVLSGHLHRQVGPTTVTAEDGSVTTAFSGGSTGGAVYAFALGSKLRRPAQVTLVTFGADGRPAGLQPVDLGTGGEVEVQAYYPLPASSGASGSPSSAPTSPVPASTTPPS